METGQKRAKVNRSGLAPTPRAAKLGEELLERRVAVLRHQEAHRVDRDALAAG